jgi:hypothetical protein
LRNMRWLYSWRARSLTSIIATKTAEITKAKAVAPKANHPMTAFNYRLRPARAPRQGGDDKYLLEASQGQVGDCASALCKYPAHEASAVVKLLIQQNEPERRGRRNRSSHGEFSTLSRLYILQQDATIQQG